MMPSRMRFGGKPAAAPGSSATIRIAETPASTTTSSGRPSATAAPIARIDSTPICQAPVPSTLEHQVGDRDADDDAADELERAADALAVVAPTAITAAIDANAGRGSGSSRTASYQATTAAAAVWRIASSASAQAGTSGDGDAARAVEDERRTDHSTIDIRQASRGFTSDCEPCHSDAMKAATNARVLRTATGRGRARPRAAADGVVIAVRATGVCRSDWHGWMGHDPAIVLPHVPGHELAGEVAAVGPEVRGFARRRPRDGAVLLRLRALRAVPRTATRRSATTTSSPGSPPGARSPSWSRSRAPTSTSCGFRRTLGFVEAASLGCRFMTAFAAVTEHGRVGAGDWVAVHGCGGVGLSALMIATALGAAVVAVDVDDAKLELARALGAAHTVTRAGDPVDADRRAAPAAARTSRSTRSAAPPRARNSIRCLRKRGRHVQVGLMLEDDRAAPVPMDRVISYELELRGVHGMAVGHYDALLRLVTSGAVDPAHLIGRTIGLDEDAGARARRHGRVRPARVSVIEL